MSSAIPFRVAYLPLAIAIAVMTAACAQNDAAGCPDTIRHLTSEQQLAGLVGQRVIVVGRMYLVDKNFGVTAKWMKSMPYLKCTGANPKGYEGIACEVGGILKKEAPFSVKNEEHAQLPYPDGDYPGEYYLDNARWSKTSEKR